MDSLNFIDQYMRKNGSPDPAQDKTVRYTGAAYAIKNLVLTTPQDLIDPEKLMEAGHIYGFLQLYDEAVDYYDQALKITPEDLNLVHCKSYTLCQKEDCQAGIDYIASIFNQYDINYDDENYCKISCSYLSALSTKNSVKLPEYKETLDNLLKHHAENNYVQMFAVRYHAAYNNNVRFLQHLAIIVELINEDETRTPLRELTDDFDAIVASAVKMAIAAADKKKTWLFVAHLMNSNYEHAEVLSLRELAAQAFPVHRNDRNSSL